MTLAVLDASVVIALLDAQDAHHRSTWQELHTLVERGAQVTLPVSAFSEVLVGVLRGGPAAMKIFDAFLEQVVGQIASITVGTAREAAALRFRHPALRLPDALVLGTGEELGADVVLTADRSWRRMSKRVHVI